MCAIQMTITKDMKKPVVLYYQLSRYYQNHRRYATSRSDVQLQGTAITAEDAKKSCEPRI